MGTGVIVPHANAVHPERVKGEKAEGILDACPQRKYAKRK